MKKVNSLFASAWDSSSCPVCLEKVWKSLTAPGSVASTLRTCPDCMPVSAFFVRRIGSGQFRPRASSSRSKSIKYYAAWTSRARRPQPSGWLALRVAHLERVLRAQVLEPRVDHRQLVEIAVAGGARELQLLDRRRQAALQSVELGLRLLHARREGFDHRVRAARGAQAPDLGIGFARAARPQQGARQAVVRRGLASVALLADRALEMLHRIARLARIGAQLGAHQLELLAVQVLPVRHARRPVLRVGDALGSNGVGTQVPGNRAVVAGAGGALHLLAKHRHRARVEAGGVERLQADAIGLALEVAGIAELRLDGPGLRRGGGAPAVTCVSCAPRLPRCSEISGSSMYAGSRKRMSRTMLSPSRRSICGDSTLSPALPRSGRFCANARGASATHAAISHAVARMCL